MTTPAHTSSRLSFAVTSALVRRIGGRDILQPNRHKHADSKL